MDKKIITSASNKLKLLDIVLHESSLNRDKDIDPLLYPQNLTQESMLGIVTNALSYKDDEKNGEEEKIFRVYASFGIRVVDPNNDKKSKKKVYFRIEATYRLDYQILKELTKNEVMEFARFNSVHNAWPFWRQHVYQFVNIAHLPYLDVPLMKGQVLSKTKKKTKKNKST